MSGKINGLVVGSGILKRVSSIAIPGRTGDGKMKRVILVILLCILFISSCSVSIRPDAKEKTLLALWALAEQELRQNVLTKEERASLSCAIDKALEVVENGRGDTFVEILTLSGIDKKKYCETVCLAALMDMLFVVEVRDDYRERIRDVLVSLKNVLGEK